MTFRDKLSRFISQTMIFYQISFGPYVKEQYDEAENLIDEYLSALIRNGQIDRNCDIVHLGMAKSWPMSTPWDSKRIAVLITANEEKSA